MGKSIVTAMSEGRMEEARQWESKVFEQVCVAGQREAVEYLGQLDESLFAARPVGWRVVGFRERTLITRFGGGASVAAIGIEMRVEHTIVCWMNIWG
jgi:hypothetical protein